MRYINRTVWILSMVSLFMDLASEMLYPVVPIYLRSIGFSLLWIGLLEGLAEFTVSLTKGYFGHWSDQTGRRLPFIRMGYLMSAISKPLMAIYASVSGVLLSRTLDRLGKGVRSAARDALLSASTAAQYKASVFNFHRSWDTAGAVLGPLAAMVLLGLTHGDYKPLFYVAFLPGLASVLLLFLIREPRQQQEHKPHKGIFSYFSYYRSASPQYRRLIIALVLFGLANSSDVFLLLRAREVTGSDTIMLSGYIVYNLVYALCAFPIGIAADRWGPKKILCLGFMLFAAVYLGFSFNENTLMVFVLFGLYGIYAGATEGIAKAWISNLAPATKTATALGLLGSLQSMATLAASTLAGWIWETNGSKTVFLLAAVLALLTIPILLSIEAVKKEASAE